MTAGQILLWISSCGLAGASAHPVHANWFARTPAMVSLNNNSRSCTCLLLLLGHVQVFQVKAHACVSKRPRTFLKRSTRERYLAARCVYAMVLDMTCASCRVPSRWRCVASFWRTFLGLHVAIPDVFAMNWVAARIFGFQRQIDSWFPFSGQPAGHQQASQYTTQWTISKPWEVGRKERNTNCQT